MRDYLCHIRIVGAVLVYQEGDQCRWSLDWLYENCDRVCIVLDNHNEETEKIVLEYRDKYPNKTHIAYCDEPVNYDKNEIPGQVKKRFKNRQGQIREFMLKELRKMHEERPIDLLVWPDSDETFINEFPRFLEKFWSSEHKWMMLGFLEVFESMQAIMTQKMAPHGRVYKYDPAMTVYPWIGRTRYYPQCLERPWKVRNVVIHVNHLTEAYRARRQQFDNIDFRTICERKIWILPKDVRRMKAADLADYQYGYRGKEPKYTPIPIDEFLANINNYDIKLWTKD